MARDISNFDDIIDSRDVIARIEELEADLEGFEDKSGSEFDELSEELKTLKALAAEGESSPDWSYGETLIRESYFTDYAQELAEDCGMVNSEATWPNNCIDWERAARELKHDYFSVEFGDVTYLIRS